MTKDHKRRKKGKRWGKHIVANVALRARRRTHLCAKRTVDSVSKKASGEGETVAIISVLQLPPSESCRMRVSFESRYGTCTGGRPPPPPPPPPAPAPAGAVAGADADDEADAPAPAAAPFKAGEGEARAEADAAAAALALALACAAAEAEAAYAGEVSAAITFPSAESERLIFLLSSSRRPLESTSQDIVDSFCSRLGLRLSL